MENSATNNDSSGYTVVARRYRPRNFSELIGQDHIAHALDTAIATGRVGHAYLFTGARGVGKTSSARIFAKALNAPQGVNEELATDIAQAIDAGEDMDVIEIDGASNRGIEEIRQLRANVSVRPSRSRYKIYIIDEVHMLTNQAFNALLKTLEEPPPHVKFIFCTTDPDKLPITVLSRCQRFDFVPIQLDAIQARLKDICAAEGFVASADALALLARRAAGSMRDSQSLLEQVMSFAEGEITVEQVQQLLGIADEAQLLALSQALADNHAIGALQLFDSASRAGADPGQLGEQLLNYFRDIMAVGVGGGPELLKLANPAGHQKLKELAERWGVQSILSAIQILDESLVRMRASVSANALLEVALVQICQLTSLASIPALLEAVMMGVGGRLPSGSASPPAPPPAKTRAGDESNTSSEKKNTSLAVDRGAVIVPVASQPIAVVAVQPRSPQHNQSVEDRLANSQASEPAIGSAPAHASYNEPPSLAAVSPSARLPVAAEASSESPSSAAGASSDALQQWRSAVGELNDILTDYASLAIAVVPKGSDHWNIVFPAGGTRPREVCEQSEKRSALEKVVAHVAKRSIRLSFSVMPGEAPRPAAAVQPSGNRVQKLREVSENPFVKKLCDVIDGEILRVDPPQQSLAGSSFTNSKKPNA